ncbi:MAG: cyclodeaminase/cyclohydrolase family protein [Lachnospiraceae bacterium]|nr:cyclodeaminase/cyclohydrolase family protein [Lachnospiraceae bacterium]
MKLTELSVTEFTKALASKTSVPGGGGASALAGSIGIALGDMVGEFTVGKKTYADVEEKMQDLMKQAQILRGKLLDCVEKDAEAFEPLSKAYGMSKDDPSRDAVMEQCLKDAAAVPMEILRLSCEALELLEGFAKMGSRIMVSDAACGAALCRAAIESAAMNVRVNTKLMKDRDHAAKLDAETDEKLKTYTKLAEKIFSKIYHA